MVFPAESQYRLKLSANAPPASNSRILGYNKQVSNLKILFYNVENLFLSLEKYQGEDIQKIDEDDWQNLRLSLTRNKSLQKTTLLAQTILEADPDIILMCEVGGSDSLHNFNQHFLQNKYQIYYDVSNSSRGIDPGILIKKELNLPTTVKNYLTFKVNGKKHKFNRNVLSIKTPQLNFFIVHLKSKLDKDNKDFNGLEARSSEILGLINILKTEMKNNTPTILAGDFNGNASLYNTDEEFRPLYQNELKLKDALEVAGVPIEQRVTHHYFKGAYCRGTQLDYLFVSENLWDKVVKEETKVIRYKNEFGETIDPPANYFQKQAYPSDHSPLLLTLKMPVTDIS